MRGYLSFILVFISVLLLLSLLRLYDASYSMDLSKAVAAERTYAVQMNVKESVIEVARQGALGGFSDYDAAHDIRLCKHCPDSFCSALPGSANQCDSAKCMACFREADARAGAIDKAVSGVHSLNNHIFDSDFEVGIGDPSIEVFLEADSFAKNGFRLGSARFTDALLVFVDSGKFAISSTAEMPEVVMTYDVAGDSGGGG
ncbi:hypothetical protein H0O00_04695 [Candidatus Micrarchaeota archaeon]|nr:hypothetical protein [Candidatus Micrarchaeota archaeon]